MSTLGSKSSTNTKSRARGANATLLAEEKDVGSLNDSDRLTAEMFTRALDTLKSDICSKIEVSISGVQTDIAGVKDKLTSSVAALQRSLSSQDEHLKDIEKSATETSDSNCSRDFCFQAPI